MHAEKKKQEIWLQTLAGACRQCWNINKGNKSQPMEKTSKDIVGLLANSKAWMVEVGTETKCEDK